MLDDALDRYLYSLDTVGDGGESFHREIFSRQWDRNAAGGHSATKRLPLVMAVIEIPKRRRLSVGIDLSRDDKLQYKLARILIHISYATIYNFYSNTITLTTSILLLALHVRD